MTVTDVLLLVLLGVAIVDKLLDLDHQCWRPGCAECAAAMNRKVA